MKHHYPFSILLLAIVGLNMTLSIFAQSLHVGDVVSEHAMSAQNSKDEVVRAPLDAYYLVTRAEDCPHDGKYVFASSVISCHDELLYQGQIKYFDTVKLKSKPVHVINGNVISSVSSSAVWKAIPMERGVFLMNERTEMYLGVSMSPTAGNVPFFASDPSPSNRKYAGCFNFANVGFDDLSNISSDESHWLGVSVWTFKQGTHKYWLEWYDDTKNFRRNSKCHVGRYLEGSPNDICPPRVFRFFSKDEPLPSRYVASRRINFDGPGFRTFYAEHAYTLPDNVKAFYAQQSGSNLDLYPISEAIPARTAVLLYKDAAGDVELRLTFEEVAPLAHRNDLRGVGHTISSAELADAYYLPYALTRDDEQPEYYYFAPCEASIPQGRAIFAMSKKKDKESHQACVLNFVVHDVVPLSVQGKHVRVANGDRDHTEQPMRDLQGRYLSKPHRGQIYIQGQQIKIAE